MNGYKDHTDESLLKLSHNGDYSAGGALIVRYTPTVVYYADRYSCLGLEKEERVKILKDALDMLKRDEREITKLMRARKKLKIHLRERGICQ